MDRRNFIKNSLFVLGGSCIACYGDVINNSNFDIKSFQFIHLTDNDLKQKYLNKSELPKTIRIDACSLCQLSCPKCFMRIHPEYTKRGVGKGYLKFKNFKKFVDENNFEEIGLANSGEIFLNPELQDIIKYAYKKNIKLTAFTGVNLNYLTDEMAETLVKYKFNDLTVSIDGASSETYAIYRRGGDFTTVINNINKINFYKKLYNSPFPKMQYKFILFGHNEHEIDQAKILAKKLNMEIVFATNYDQSYSPVKNVNLIKQKIGIDPSVDLSKAYAQEYLKNHACWWHCKALWEAPQINWDGKMMGCYCLYDNSFSGNVFKDGLLNVLNHPKMIYAKNMILGNENPVKGIPCTDCKAFELMKKMNIRLMPLDKQGKNWA